MKNKNNKDRWQLRDKNSIEWDVAGDNHLPHYDHLEMSGKMVSVIVNYGIDENGDLSLLRNIYYPMLRTIPNITYASFNKEYGNDTEPKIRINGKKLKEKPYQIIFDGVLIVNSHAGDNIDIKRSIFPSTESQACLDYISLKNNGNDTVIISLENNSSICTARGIYGIYILECRTNTSDSIILKPGDEASFAIYFTARKVMDKPLELDVIKEIINRQAFISTVSDSLIFDCPNPVLNAAFNMSKIRAAESIFNTKGGLMHSPGGGPYYAALWTNDEAEYSGPFFPFLGYGAGNEASLNCYRQYMKFMGPDYTPIPASIIAEGVDIWEGAGDRGDAAMYAYGASRFALETGNREIGEELYPAIKWCLEYCKRRTTADGVIASDSDELEGRFPSGGANLSTSSLAYGALRTTAFLASELGKEDEAAEYNTRADVLEQAIENYFGACIEGFDTYRYYDGNDILRSWICLPLSMGIMKRKDATIEALFSPRLWTDDGLATQSGDTTFWDRSTLYALRGVFFAGESEKALSFFNYYSERRLLGEHVPYAVEAYPEGNQRHLSAESALYCRVVTEGLFGIVPVGFNSFYCIPRIPDTWDEMKLLSIKAFGTVFDLTVKRMKTGVTVIVSNNNIVREYKAVSFEGVKINLYNISNVQNVSENRNDIKEGIKKTRNYKK